MPFSGASRASWPAHTKTTHSTTVATIHVATAVLESATGARHPSIIHPLSLVATLVPWSSIIALRFSRPTSVVPTHPVHVVASTVPTNISLRAIVSPMMHHAWLAHARLRGPHSRHDHIVL